TAGAGAAGLVAGAGRLAAVYGIAQAPELSRLVWPAAAVVVVAGIGVAAAALRRRAGALAAVLAVAGAGGAAVVLYAEIVVAPLFPWQPVAAALAITPPDTDVVFEAPEEYQIVGGLAYYLGRRVTLIEPPGFVPPTYLAGHTAEMFVSSADVGRRWTPGQLLALVSDP